MIKYCFINQKGGVGKTTSCLNVGAALAKKGYKVLLVDTDAQGSLTQSAGVQISDEAPTVLEVLRGAADINAAIVERGRYCILPADIRLSGADLELNNVIGRERLLQEALAKLNRPFDYILIDCPPTLSLITVMSLAAADKVIIPIQAHYLALNGCAQLLDTIKLVKARINTGLEIGGVIVTMYDSRKNLANEVADNIRAAFPAKVFNNFIPDNVSLAEAPAFGRDIFEYKPDSKGAQQYEALTEEIITRTKES